ncbi:hypothetical protein K474DRAFT_1770376 [Panus rudis PR-1116 ss-1]|nr:hypothetical protein K474DRAFT_1770376 [Panus rudis PR-1116 ss-1]
MHSRALSAIFLTLLSLSSVVTSSPIDEVNALNVAMNNNLGCSAPDGCQRNATQLAAAAASASASASSGALPSLSGGVAAPAIALIAAGALSALL